MGEETNEKVLAMYRAVCELAEDGYELSDVKVSDITARAGIGKGTAYEYFRSKEEILLRAMEYDFTQQYQELRQALECSLSFKKAVEYAFDWIERNMSRKRLAYQTLKFVDELRKKAKHMEEDCVRQKMKKGAGLFDEILDILAELGKKEGIIRHDIVQELVRVEIYSRFTGYFVYLQGEEKDKREKQQVRDFLYENLIKSLG